jgi:hypothetical protein
MYCTSVIHSAAVMRTAIGASNESPFSSTGASVGLAVGILFVTLGAAVTAIRPIENSSTSQLQRQAMWSSDQTHGSVDRLLLSHRVHRGDWRDRRSRGRVESRLPPTSQRSQNATPCRYHMAL